MKQKIFTFLFATLMSASMFGVTVQQDISIAASDWNWGYNSMVVNNGNMLQCTLTGEWGAASTGWYPTTDLSDWDKIVVVVENMNGCDGEWFKLKAYLRDNTESEANQMESTLGNDAQDNAQNYLVIDLHQHQNMDLTQAKILAVQCQPNGAIFKISRVYLEKEEANAQEPITIRLTMPSYISATPNIFAWTNNGNHAGNWPGTPMTSLGNRQFSYTFDSSLSSVNIIFNYDNDYNENVQTADINAVTSSTCYKLTGDFDNDYYLAYQQIDCSEEPEPMDTIMIRLDPNSVDWGEAYIYAWTGSSYYGNYYNKRLVAGQKMTLAEDGWWMYSVEVSPGTSFYVGFDYRLDGEPNYYEDANYNSMLCSESTCFEFNKDRYLQTTSYKSLVPDESNTFAVHVATAGTFGQVMVQTLGELTWADVAALTVTGSLNESDMNYFYRMTNLQQLDLSGTNLTFIGGCNGLAKLRIVVLPATCTAINDNAFNGCKRLSSINLTNIQTVGNYAFYQVSHLPELNMPNVLSIGNYAFAMSTDYNYSSSALQTVNMPIVQTIGDYAFSYHSNMESVTMPLVTSIGQYAFRACSSLVQVDLSNCLNLGVGAFYMYLDEYGYSEYPLPNLSQVTLSEELEEIPDGCFHGCWKLRSITLPATLKSIGSYALEFLTSVELPANIESVGSGNFWYVTSITIPAKVTSWGAYSSNWTDVYCHVVAPPTFSVFNNDNVANATLHVPAVSLAAYKLHDNWYKFGRIIPMEGEISDITINDKFTLLTTEGIANNADLTLDSYGELTVSAGNTLALDNYLQWICTNNKIYKSSYSDGNEYYYSYMAYTGTLLANSAITANNVCVYLVIENNRWNFFSLPFDVDMSQFDDYGSDWIIREYSGANRASGNGATWNNVPANGMLHAHTGYIIYRTSANWGTGRAMNAMNNANMQNIFAAGDVNVPLTEYSAEFPQNRSWNLIGNPYPCSYDIQYLDFDAPITTWNGSGYEAYTTTDDNYMLRPAEAFFVQAPQGTTQITFHKEGRSVINYQEVTQEEYNNHRYYYAPKRSHVSNNDRKVFNFTLSNADYSDRARLVLNAQASADYELTRDAAKMMSSDKTVPQLFVNNNGVQYAIDERPEQAIYTLGAFIGKAGEYTLHLYVPENEDRQIILTDTETQTTTILSQGDYTFHAEAGMFESRFHISFVQNGTEGIDEASSLMAPTKTIQNGQLMIIKNDKMYNAQGQVVNQ